MIENWLETFKQAWLAKDIDTVMSLFSDDVEYWETPFRQVANAEELRNEWSAIHSQSHIELSLSVFGTESGRHSILWKLSYTDANNCPQNWAGTYLLKLNSDGKCTYFFQTGEKL